MKNYTGKLNTKFWWLIPYILGFSESNVDNKAIVLAIHLSIFIEIGINIKKNKIETTE